MITSGRNIRGRKKGSIKSPLHTEIHDNQTFKCVIRVETCVGQFMYYYTKQRSHFYQIISMNNGIHLEKEKKVYTYIAVKS